MDPTEAATEDGPDAATVAEELRAREPLTHREPRDADRRHFERLLAPGMTWVGASGRRLDRDAYLESTLHRYETGDHGDDHTWAVEDFRVRPVSDPLWCAAYTLHQGERTTARFTLWERVADGWRAHHHQGTPIAGGAS